MTKKKISKQRQSIIDEIDLMMRAWKLQDIVLDLIDRKKLRHSDFQVSMNKILNKNKVSWCDCDHGESEDEPDLVAYEYGECRRKNCGIEKAHQHCAKCKKVIGIG